MKSKEHPRGEEGSRDVALNFVLIIKLAAFRACLAKKHFRRTSDVSLNGGYFERLDDRAICNHGAPFNNVFKIKQTRYTFHLHRVLLAGTEAIAARRLSLIRRLRQQSEGKVT